MHQLAVLHNFPGQVGGKFRHTASMGPHYRIVQLSSVFSKKKKPFQSYTNQAPDDDDLNL